MTLKIRNAKISYIKPLKKVLIFIFLSFIITSFQIGFFHEELKMTKVFPSFVKKDSPGKETCRPVSIFPRMAKILKD